MGRTKKLLICSVCIIGIGLILAVTGFSMGGKFGIIKSNTGYKILDKEDIVIKNEELSDFKSIEINSNLDKIDIIKSDKYGIEIEYGKNENEVNYLIKDGKLVIKQENSQGIMNNIHFGVVNIYMPNYIKVYVPNEVDLDTIDVKSSTTNFTMDSVNANEISINCSYGKIDAKNVVTKDLKLDMKSGNVKLENIKSNNNAVLKNSYGNMKIKNSEFNVLSNYMNNGNFEMDNVKVDNETIDSKYGKIKANNLIANGLKVESNNGDIDLDGEFKGITSISSRYGNIKFRTNIAKELYNYSVLCDYGNINIDGDKFEKKVQNNGNNTQNTIDITSSNGDINMDFK